MLSCVRGATGNPASAVRRDRASESKARTVVVATTARLVSLVGIGVDG